MRHSNACIISQNKFWTDNMKNIDWYQDWDHRGLTNYFWIRDHRDSRATDEATMVEIKVLTFIKQW